MPKTNAGPCVVDGCDARAAYVKMCSAHYARKRKGKDLHDPPIVRLRPKALCDVEGCQRPHYAKRLCTFHYDRVRYGVPFDKPVRDGRIKDRKGYVMLRMPEHPSAYRDKYILEHRYVMEQMLGRYLETFENVHHKNGKRDDNRPENLELWVTMQPTGQRVQDLVAYARDILLRYQPEALAD